MSFSHFRFLFNFFLLSCRNSSRAVGLMGEPQIAQIKESLVFPEKYCHLLDKKIIRQSTSTCLKRSKLLSTCCASESICTLQASKVSPCGQHWACFVFLSQWFSTPRTVFIVVSEKNPPKISPPPKKSLPTEILFMYSQCNKNSNENGTSTERIERDVAAAAEFVRTLF